MTASIYEISLEFSQDMKKRKRRTMRMKRTVRKTLRMKKTCRTWMK